MNTWTRTAAAFVLTLSLTSLAQAAKKPVAAHKQSRTGVAAPKPADTTALAKTALARLAAAYKTGQVVDYSSTVTMNVPTSPGAQTTSTVVTATATVARPNLFHIETSQNGKLVAVLNGDGKTVTVYDPSQGEYAKVDSGPTFRESMGAAQRAAVGLFGQPGVTKFIGAMVMPQIFFSAQPDLGSVSGSPGIRYSANTEMIDGVKTVRVAQRLAGQGGSSAVFLFYLDAATGLPKRFAQDYARGTKSLELIREDYTGYQIGTGVEGPAFVWTPPATATLAPQPTAAAPPQVPPLLPTGTIARDFSVRAADGKTVKMSDYAGKVVVIDFWATWCGPCQDALVSTDKIAEAYAPKGVVFLPICSNDSEANFKDWVGKHANMKMTFYFDPAGEDAGSSIAYKTYSDQIFPMQYVIGKDGKIAAGLYGYSPATDPSEKELQQALDKALAAS